jgi:hypothetical protein
MKNQRKKAQAPPAGGRRPSTKDGGDTPRHGHAHPEAYRIKANGTVERIKDECD